MGMGLAVFQPASACFSKQIYETMYIRVWNISIDFILGVLQLESISAILDAVDEQHKVKSLIFPYLMQCVEYR